MDVENLRNTLQQFDQGHLLAHWDSLTDDEKEELYTDLSSIDYEEMTTIFKKATSTGGTVNFLPLQMCTVLSMCKYVSRQKRERERHS